MVTRGNTFSDAQILDALQVLAACLHRVPTSYDWKLHVKHPVVALVRQRFGSWEQALSLADLGALREHTADELRLITGLEAVVASYAATRRSHPAQERAL